jgi:hypothetical protein
MDAVWTAAERQQFAARGGVASAIATAVSAKSSASFNPEEALDVSEDAILALFGQNRTAVLRMTGLPLQKECEKDWKMRCAQAKEYEKQGRKVPSGFIKPQWFFTFQYYRNLLLTAAPLKVHDIEQWAWMFARWAITDASDMCKDSEFTQILAKADSMASDVASQGGGAGPGRDRHRRARSAVRAGWRGGPSPGTASGHRGRGQEDPGSRAAAATAQGQGSAHPRIVWEFHLRILGSSAARQSPGRASSAGGESPDRIGQSLAATRP